MRYEIFQIRTHHRWFLHRRGRRPGGPKINSVGDTSTSHASLLTFVGADTHQVARFISVEIGVRSYPKIWDMRYEIFQIRTHHRWFPHRRGRRPRRPENQFRRRHLNFSRITSHFRRGRRPSSGPFCQCGDRSAECGVIRRYEIWDMRYEIFQIRTHPRWFPHRRGRRPRRPDNQFRRRHLNFSRITSHFRRGRRPSSGPLRYLQISGFFRREQAPALQ